MSLLQRKVPCTVHDGHGGRCGTIDQCTRVVTEGAGGVVLHEHDVCAQHRKEMGLPEWDVRITPSGELRRFDPE